mgnify:CR=1 FL=1
MVTSAQPGNRVTEYTRDGLTFTMGTPKSPTYPGSMPVVGNFDGPGASEYGVFDIVGGKGVWTLTTPNMGTRTVVFAAATTGVTFRYKLSWWKL